jgi:hypothetical protein
VIYNLPAIISYKIMPNDPNQSDQTPDTPQAFEDINISVNGKNYSSTQELPPEVQQKLQDAMSKLRQNPGLFNLVGGLAGLAKTANQIGITRIPDLTNIINSTAETTTESPPGQPSSTGTLPSPGNPDPSTPAGETLYQASPQSYRQINNQRNFAPTFNPVVKGDGLRKVIFVIIMAGLIGYLLYRYGFQGKLPF